MAKTKEVVKATPQTQAVQLREAEMDLELIEARVKELRQNLLDNLKSQGVRRVDLENGDSYIIAQRDNLVITNERSALAWAFENPEARMKLDTSAALKVAKMSKLKWAKVETKEHLRITRAKNKEE